jgi:hypothetical protein
LQEALGISKTSISQHLSILKSAGVLSTRREGKQIYCSLAMPEVKRACQLIRKVWQGQDRGKPSPGRPRLPQKGAEDNLSGKLINHENDY